MKWYKGPAKIVHAPLDTKAIAGESILFFCQAEGNPLPRVVLHWNDSEITQNRSGLQFKEISVDSVALRAKLELNHNGDTVMCFAENHVGSDSVTAQISVYSANEKGSLEKINNIISSVSRYFDFQPYWNLIDSILSALQ
ncbi:hypothetical protein MN116_008915 [Schistosoma mekongi]|uniref:Ig-like domain-containing protein n=1 Tax=Schistosoma mekongi TaxID=38744 RepID=A0AAE1Z5Q2_SCHME|nr:hypothetical protein MN116_008915 [Schistosoma mekongi]